MSSEFDDYDPDPGYEPDYPDPPSELEGAFSEDFLEAFFRAVVAERDVSYTAEQRKAINVETVPRERERARGHWAGLNAEARLERGVDDAIEHVDHWRKIASRLFIALEGATTPDNDISPDFIKEVQAEYTTAMYQDEDPF